MQFSQNAGNDKDWLRRGGVGLSYQPALGVLRLHVDRIEEVFASPSSLLRSTISALLDSLPITFAQTNVQQLVEGELLLYSVDRAPFPHREFLGWMGYVDVPLTRDQVPAAARLERRAVAPSSSPRRYSILLMRMPSNRPTRSR